MKNKMGLNATWCMAVGGMIGGGIFSVLGVVVEASGYMAWLILVTYWWVHSYNECIRFYIRQLPDKYYWWGPVGSSIFCIVDYRYFSNRESSWSR